MSTFVYEGGGKVCHPLADFSMPLQTLPCIRSRGRCRRDTL